MEEEKKKKACQSLAGMGHISRKFRENKGFFITFTGRRGPTRKLKTTNFVVKMPFKYSYHRF